MGLVSASLQPYVSQAIEFFQIHEKDAALHTFLLHLHTLRTKNVIRIHHLHKQNIHIFFSITNKIYHGLLCFFLQRPESGIMLCLSVFFDDASYPLLGSICFEILDLTHEISQTLTWLLELLVILLSISAVQFNLLAVHTYVLNNKRVLSCNIWLGNIQWLSNNTETFRNILKFLNSTLIAISFLW